MPEAVRGSGTVSVVSEPLRLTIVYEDAGDGWVLARIPQVRGAISQGQTRDEARDNVIDALREVLAVRFGAPPSVQARRTASRSSSRSRRETSSWSATYARTGPSCSMGSRHSVWMIGGPDSERIAAVPRHNEIRPGTVRAICRDLEIPTPAGR